MNLMKKKKLLINDPSVRESFLQLYSKVQKVFWSETS
jgi:hypothetical protein